MKLMEMLPAADWDNVKNSPVQKKKKTPEVCVLTKGCNDPALPAGVLM